jgi:hypothetical protein
MDTKNDFWCFYGIYPLHFYALNLVKRRCASLLVPPRSPKLGGAMLKNFIQISVLYNIVERLVLTSQGTTMLLDGSMSQ